MLGERSPVVFRVEVADWRVYYTLRAVWNGLFAEQRHHIETEPVTSIGANDERKDATLMWC